VTNLSRYLVESATRYPESVALHCEDTVTTYARLNDHVSRLAGYLIAHGIEPGDRVGIMLPNIASFAIAFYGILHAGAVVVPMNPLQSSREVEFFLNNTNAKLLLHTPEFASAATEGAGAANTTAQQVDDRTILRLVESCTPQPHPVARDDADNAVILHTSGTTGVPKGAQLTHGNLIKNQDIFAEDLLGLGPTDVIMGCLPLLHAFGMTCALTSGLSHAADLVLMPRFDPKRVLAAIAAEKVTVFEGVPTMYSALLSAAEGVDVDASSLRVCVSGGAALPVEVLRQFEARFGCIILEGYGLSETSPVASFNHPNAVRKVGSVGTPIRGVQMRVVDERGNELPVGEPGEVQIRGHNVMKGYLGLPEATAASIVDGWFATGDIGRIDDDGYFYIVDRKKALIIRGGYNVYPREIEEVLYEHPAVAEAAVVGIAHDTLGEEVGAAVALVPGATTTVDELQAFVKERVAAYKYPRRIWLVDSLPMGPTGKILRRQIVVPEMQD
jgi:long-chain acyl-CoA synthetase